MLLHKFDHVFSFSFLLSSKQSNCLIITRKIQVQNALPAKCLQYTLTNIFKERIAWKQSNMCSLWQNRNYRKTETKQHKFS